jgi:hypothetical protein
MSARRLLASTIDRRSLQRRLRELERRIGSDDRPADLVSVVFVEANGEFGGKECDSYRAEGGGRVWHRKPSETLEEFKYRMKAVCKDLSIAIVIFW